MQHESDSPRVPSSSEPTLTGAATFGDTRTLGSGPVTADRPEARRPRTLGRYVIHDVLGRGATGIVYAAHDPELGRDVALKVLTPSRRDELATARLRREARTLAKLEHRNVVAVYDVGEQHGELYIAMELVEGGTLKTWLRARPRPWRELLATFAAAGRGLVAAHEAGLVHRDFKPDNVLIDRLGQPRVVDFGLARLIEDEQVETHPDGLLTDASGDPTASITRASHLTRAGAIMGTPSYMAPEQYRGEETDARADQWAFCVALWEALYGERPFTGNSLVELAEAVTSGRINLGPQRGVPRAIRSILLRGLEVDRQRRWPTLAALIDALEAVPRRRHKLAISTVAAALGLGLVGVTWAFASQSTHELAPVCVDTSSRVDSIWTDARRAAIGTALARAGGDAVASTQAFVLAQLDDYARTLAAGFEQACLDTEVRQLLSPALRDRRVRCLIERLDALDAAAGRLATLDAADLRQATRLVVELPAIDRCADIDHLATLLPDPESPQLAEAVAQARRELALANADLTAVRIDDADAALARASAIMAGLEHPPFAVELEFARARLATLRGHYQQAATQLEEVYHRAFSISHDELASKVVLELIVALGTDLGDPERGLAWARHAQSLIDRSDDRRAAARLLDVRGKLHYRLEEYEQASELFEQALAIHRRELGPRSVEVAHSLNDLANALDRLDRRDRARELLAEAIAIKLETLGEYSSSTAGSLTNMGLLLWKDGEYEQAIEHHQHALAVFERAYGPKHRSVAGTSLNLAKALHSAERAEQALPIIERALAIVREAENDAPGLEVMLVNIHAAVFDQLGRWDQARDAYATELALLQRMHGDASPKLASALLGLAEVANASGDHHQAIEHAERVLALQPEDQPGWDQAADAHLSLAEAFVGLGKPAQARPHAIVARDRFAEIGGRREDERAEAEAILAQLDASD